jgi:hypothetical protein
MLWGVYVVLALVIGLALFDRFAAWDVTEHTTTYFGPDGGNPQHTGGQVLYAQIPPVGGPHANAPQACGFYSAYIHNEHAVHSLEHGAIWITYGSSVQGDDLAKLEALASQPYTLVSPYPDLPAPIVVSAWGHQMTLDSVDTEKIDAFRAQYGNNREYTPEFGASCGIRFTETTDVQPQTTPWVPDAGDDTEGGIVATSDASEPAGATPNASPAVPMGTPLASPASIG